MIRPQSYLTSLLDTKELPTFRVAPFILNTMPTHEEYMQRCLTLAALGAGQVSPNPMVGAVLVHQDRIIGEGWHREYGQAHAEVNCIDSVAEADRALIPQSTMYVSLEPCAHFGRTPPCADLIVKHRIPRVVIGCTDTFSQVSGRGIARLEAAGIEVMQGVLEATCRRLNRRFFTRQERQRPYVILKWAQSEDGFIAPPEGRRVMLSNTFSQKWVHRMRSEEDAVLVGYRTALLDDPQLNNRYGSGRQPLRVVVDPQLALPATLKLMDGTQSTIILNRLKTAAQPNLQWLQVEADEPAAWLRQLVQVNSIIIEGGARTLQQFIAAGLWDEAFVIRTPQLLGAGTPAPTLQHAIRQDIIHLETDHIYHYDNEHTTRLYPNQ
ncbi:bifunctional diaminohydroxyphosphoribosylaminopyrimidine deaminase/5-amino-6-(5-phosphoribosylamino)uracil reductase RibD [Taibaiella helva]|uniref:bifunctional diaminohydroxyphosphoribosylaminopyrimidine deaminase/5-amino-6-(5-phosphoribosylamino)uracil reductase RibD n=1 Tax=Taibaiella helva TaxID=2301235 RepID=UPI001E5177BC|nr:bifunctional diaminohydroxyphosphoribosylaminopyrimidine deaminase/5-amino-6-(5-phosphoribosylamino)uracil reductase RibD [Taibaiella helva]